MSSGERFVADVMLGRLARYLRLLGFDTAYRADVADDELAAWARREARVLLTRDSALLREKKVDRHLFVESTDPLAQLRQVVAAFRLDWRASALSRCSVCNTRVEPASAAEVERSAPRHVRERHVRFLRCPSCERLYWEGSHVERLRLRLERALSDG